MTFQSSVWAVDGNTVSGALARLQLQASTLGAQGVVGHLDCIVQATTPSPTAGIVITPGQVVILGQETTYQGSYYGWNIGNDTSLSIAATAVPASVPNSCQAKLATAVPNTAVNVSVAGAEPVAIVGAPDTSLK